jgi:hypothetical protein
MHLFRSFSKHSALVLAAAVGLSACSDEPTTLGGGLTDRAAISLSVSSGAAAAGARVAVAVDLDAAPGRAGGFQGTLSFDPARMRYVGQSPVGDVVTMANASDAAAGSVRFVSFNPAGVSGRAALFVFEVAAANYAQSLRYDHQIAATAGADLEKLPVTVRREVAIDGSLSVPADARALSVADWNALLGGTGTTSPVALRPGEYRLNLEYGDVNFDNLLNLTDYLFAANASVGNQSLIVGTDGPAVDLDLVIAANVFPDNGGGACGTEVDGTRAIDLFDLLVIANEVVGTDAACVGDVIPGRGPLPTTRQSITAISSPDLTIGVGEVVTLTNDRIWQIEGILRVQDGGRLNIEAGTRVEGLTEAGETQAIFVERGGQMFAEGTQNQPIVMTCTAATKFKGCWGGVAVTGRGTVNLGDGTLGQSPDGGCNQRRLEGNGPLYGGCNPDDNSGVIRYTVIEYGGRVIGADNELNGLTLGGVGRGTTIEYVQIHAGTDDGIEFFGGEVNTRYLVLTGNDDDGFDVSFGYTGENQFVIAQNDFGNPGGDSKAIEADGNEPAPGAILTPRTAPQLYNFTMIGNLSQQTGSNAAMHLRRGVGLTLANSLVAGYGIGLDIDDPLTCDGFGTGPVRIINTTFIDIADLGNSDSGDPACVAGGSTTEGEEDFINAEATNRVRTGLASVLIDATNTDLPDWRMLLVGGLPAEAGTAAPPAGSTFIVSTNYRGAVAPAASAGTIPWYSGWTRPFQSATTP